MPRDPARQRIFVSYARSDGEVFARDLRETLAGLSFSLWHDRQDLEGGRDWWRQITEAIDAAEYLVLVMTPGALGSDVIRREWRYARQQGRCVVPVFGVRPLDLSGLPRWMASAHVYDLDIPEQSKRFVRQLESPCEIRRVPMMAPPPPTDFVARPEEFAALKAALLDERGEPVAITSALKGAGGYGKTTLAKALCADDDIQDAFHDGVLWLTLGERPGDPQGRIEDLIRVLRGARESFATRDAALARLGETLGDRRCLLVLDDVWHRGDAEPFLWVGPLCARLLTTRDSATLPKAARDIRVDELEPDQAVELLQTGLPAADPARLRALAARLGEWPLLLKLANAALHERVGRPNKSLPKALDNVKELLDRRGLAAFDPGNARSRDEAVGITLGLSLDVLSEAERDRLSELALFPEDLDIPLAAVELLWRQTAGIDEIDAEDLLCRLFALSLLLDLDLAGRTVRLHDMIRDWLRRGLGDDGLTKLHRALVAGYRELCAGDWHELADDGYAFQHLPGHLSAIDEAVWRDLLLDPRWMARKLERVSLAALIGDYRHSEDEGLRLIGEALRLSAHALGHDPAQLPAQLWGRLGKLNHQACERLAAAARSSLGQGVLATRFPSLTAPGEALLQVLKGHEDWVQAVAVTPDGLQAISGGMDGTLRVWNLGSGTERHRLLGHRGGVRAVTVTPDSRSAISGDEGGRLRIWDLTSVAESFCLEGHGAAIRAVAVTCDGTRVISGSNDGTLRIWDLAGRVERLRLEGHTEAVQAIAVTPDDHRVVSGGRDRTLRVWDLASGAEQMCLAGHDAGINAVAVTPDGRHAISGANDGTYRIWDLTTGNAQHCLKGTGGFVLTIAVTRDGRQVISGCADGMLQVWDLASRDKVRHIGGHGAWVRAVAVTPDGRHAISGGDDHALRIWDLAIDFEHHKTAVQALAVLPGGQRVLSGGADGALQIWDAESGGQIHRFEGDPWDWILAAAITPDGCQAVTGGNSSNLQIWDLTSGERVCRFEGHALWIRALAVTSDGRHVVSGGDDGTVRIWDLERRTERYRLDNRSEWVRTVAVTPDGRSAISGDGDGTLRVWNIASGVELRCIEALGHSIEAVAVTPDGRSVVSGDNHGTLRVWDLTSGDEQHRLKGLGGSILAVAVTPDGKQAISGGNDGTLRAWDLDGGALVSTLTFDNPLHAIAAISSSMFAVGDADGGVHFVELTRPQPENGVRLQRRL